MKENRFFLDTAYVLALLNPKDTYHKYAKMMLPSMHSAREVWLTEAVLIEIANALASSGRPYFERGIYSRRPLSAGRLPGTVT
ncbi:MAG: hypothetical protein PHH85_08605 [Candidatus Methanoperedens sp.]|nr:hypothetical protein [Candidatus Methanoperedens sp.]